MTSITLYQPTIKIPVEKLPKGLGRIVIISRSAPNRDPLTPLLPSVPESTGPLGIRTFFYFL